MAREAFAEWLQYLRLDGDSRLADELEMAAGKLSRPSDPGRQLGRVTPAYYRRKAQTQNMSRQ